MKTFLTIGFVFCISYLYAQQPIVLETESLITSDHLQQSYRIMGQSLIKEEDGEVRVYQNPFLGNLTRLDIRNPLELVLFFDESNQMIVLDNQLSEKFSLNFNLEFPEIDPIFVGSASKNFYWVVDGISKQIYFLDYGNRNLRLISNPINFQKYWLYNDANWFYWIDEQKVYQINMYGVTKEYELNLFFQRIVIFKGNHLIFEREGKRYSYDVINEKEIMLDDFSKEDIK